MKRARRSLGASAGLHRKKLLVVSALLTITAIMAIACWIRSYHTADDIDVIRIRDSEPNKILYLVEVSSEGGEAALLFQRREGKVVVDEDSDINASGIRHSEYPTNGEPGFLNLANSMGFEWRASAAEVRGRHYNGCILVVPYWFVVSLLSLLPVGGLLRRFFRRPRAAGMCPNCGYDVRATPERCPECGTILAPEVMQGPTRPRSPAESAWSKLCFAGHWLWQNRLRIANYLAAASGLFAVAITALWIRSYWRGASFGRYDDSTLFGFSRFDFLNGLFVAERPNSDPSLIPAQFVVLAACVLPALMTLLHYSRLRANRRAQSRATRV